MPSNYDGMDAAAASRQAAAARNTSAPAPARQYWFRGVAYSTYSGYQRAVTRYNSQVAAQAAAAQAAKNAAAAQAAARKQAEAYAARLRQQAQVAARQQAEAAAQAAARKAAADELARQRAAAEAQMRAEAEKRRLAAEAAAAKARLEALARAQRTAATERARQAAMARVREEQRRIADRQRALARQQGWNALAQQAAAMRTQAQQRLLGFEGRDTNRPKGRSVTQQYLAAENQRLTAPGDWRTRGRTPTMLDARGGPRTDAEVQRQSAMKRYVKTKDPMELLAYMDKQSRRSGGRYIDQTVYQTVYRQHMVPALRVREEVLPVLDEIRAAESRGDVDTMLRLLEESREARAEFVRQWGDGREPGVAQPIMEGLQRLTARQGNMIAQTIGGSASLLSLSDEQRMQMRLQNRIGRSAFGYGLQDDELEWQRGAIRGRQGPINRAGVLQYDLEVDDPTEDGINRGTKGKRTWSGMPVEDARRTIRLYGMDAYIAREQARERLIYEEALREQRREGWGRAARGRVFIDDDERTNAGNAPNRNAAALNVAAEAMFTSSAHLLRRWEKIAGEPDGAHREILRQRFLDEIGDAFLTQFRSDTNRRDYQHIVTSAARQSKPFKDFMSQIAMMFRFNATDEPGDPGEFMGSYTPLINRAMIAADDLVNPVINEWAAATRFSSGRAHRVDGNIHELTSEDWDWKNLTSSEWANRRSEFSPEIDREFKIWQRDKNSPDGEIRARAHRRWANVWLGNSQLRLAATVGLDPLNALGLVTKPISAARLAMQTSRGVGGIARKTIDYMLPRLTRPGTDMGGRTARWFDSANYYHVRADQARVEAAAVLNKPVKEVLEWSDEDWEEFVRVTRMGQVDLIGETSIGQQLLEAGDVSHAQLLAFVQQNLPAILNRYGVIGGDVYKQIRELQQIDEAVIRAPAIRETAEELISRPAQAQRQQQALATARRARGDRAGAERIRKAEIEVDSASARLRGAERELELLEEESSIAAATLRHQMGIPDELVEKRQLKMLEIAEFQGNQPMLRGEMKKRIDATIAAIRAKRAAGDKVPRYLWEELRLWREKAASILDERGNYPWGAQYHKMQRELRAIDAEIEAAQKASGVYKHYNEPGIIADIKAGRERPRRSARSRREPSARRGTQESGVAEPHRAGGPDRVSAHKRVGRGRAVRGVKNYFGRGLHLSGDDAVWRAVDEVVDRTPSGSRNTKAARADKLVRAEATEQIGRGGEIVTKVGRKKGQVLDTELSVQKRRLAAAHYRLNTGARILRVSSPGELRDAFRALGLKAGKGPESLKELVDAARKAGYEGFEITNLRKWKGANADLIRRGVKGDTLVVFDPKKSGAWVEQVALKPADTLGAAKKVEAARERLMKAKRALKQAEREYLPNRVPKVVERKPSPERGTRTQWWVPGGTEIGPGKTDAMFSIGGAEKIDGRLVARGHWQDSQYHKYWDPNKGENGGWRTQKLTESRKVPVVEYDVLLSSLKQLSDEYGALVDRGAYLADLLRSGKAAMPIQRRAMSEMREITRAMRKYEDQVSVLADDTIDRKLGPITQALNDISQYHKRVGGDPFGPGSVDTTFARLREEVHYMNGQISDLNRQIARGGDVAELKEQRQMFLDAKEAIAAEARVLDRGRSAARRHAVAHLDRVRPAVKGEQIAHVAIDDDALRFGVSRDLNRLLHRVERVVSPSRTIEQQNLLDLVDDLVQRFDRVAVDSVKMTDGKPFRINATKSGRALQHHVRPGGDPLTVWEAWIIVEEAMKSRVWRAKYGGLRRILRAEIMKAAKQGKPGWDGKAADLLRAVKQEHWVRPPVIENPYGAYKAFDNDVSELIRNRRGWEAEGQIGMAAKPNTAGKPKPVQRIRGDSDPLVTMAKLEVSRERGLSIFAYDEMRGLFADSMLREGRALELRKDALAAAAAKGTTFEEEFIRLRALRAEEESVRNFVEFSLRPEFRGMPQEHILRMFEERHIFDQLGGRRGLKVSPFQHRILNGAFREVTGFVWTDDALRRHWFQSGALVHRAGLRLIHAGEFGAMGEDFRKVFPQVPVYEVTDEDLFKALELDAGPGTVIHDGSGALITQGKYAGQRYDEVFAPGIYVKPGHLDDPMNLWHEAFHTFWKNPKAADRVKAISAALDEFDLVQLNDLLRLGHTAEDLAKGSDVASEVIAEMYALWQKGGSEWDEFVAAASGMSVGRRLNHFALPENAASIRRSGWNPDLAGPDSTFGLDRKWARLGDGVYLSADDARWNRLRPDEPPTRPGQLDEYGQRNDPFEAVEFEIAPDAKIRVIDSYDELLAAFRESRTSYTVDRVRPEELRDMARGLRRQGYDGIEIRNYSDDWDAGLRADQVVIWNQDKIRLAPQMSAEASGARARALGNIVDEFNKVSGPDSDMFTVGGPPLGNRKAMHDWAVAQGRWSPHTGDDIRKGRRIWTIGDERQFYNEEFGYTPPWTDPDILRVILRDQRAYQRAFREWGFADDSFERLVDGEGLKGKKLKDALAWGKDGLPTQRTWVEMRDYFLSRYGDLVADDAGRFHTVPWLMKADETEYLPWLEHTLSPAGREEAAEWLELAKDKMTPFLRREYFDDAGKLRAHGLDIDPTLLGARNVKDPAKLLASLDRALLKATKRRLLRMSNREAWATSEWMSNEILRFAMDVTDDLLGDQAWRGLFRGRRWWQQILHMAGFQRALVSLQIAFPIMNLMESYGYKRGLLAMAYNGWAPIGISGQRWAHRIRTLEDIGDTSVARLFGVEGRDGIRTFGRRSLDGNLSPMRRLTAGIDDVVSLPVKVSANGEAALRLDFARVNYGKSYTALRAGGMSDGAADAIARLHAKRLNDAFFASIGDDVVMQALNQMVPFMSYRWKQMTLAFGMSVRHPWIPLTLAKIQDQIIRANREEYIKVNGTDEGFDENDPRTHSLWVDMGDGSFLQIPIWDVSDWSRSMRTAYQVVERGGRVQDVINEFVRIPHPLQQGVWAALTGGETPWGRPGDWREVIWLVDVARWAFGDDYEKPQWQRDPLQMASQILFFKAFGRLTEGELRAMVFWGMKDAGDDAAARAYIEAHPELQAYFDLVRPYSRGGWDPIHGRPKRNQLSDDVWDEYGEAMEGWEALKNSLDAEIHRYALQPWSDEYRAAKRNKTAMMLQYQRDNPILRQVWALYKTPAEFAEMRESWIVDDQVNVWFHVYGNRPRQADYPSEIAYYDALVRHNREKIAWLEAHPGVAERLYQTNNALVQAWHDQELQWAEILDFSARLQARILREELKLTGDYEADQEQRDFISQLYEIKDFANDILNSEAPFIGDTNLVPGSNTKNNILNRAVDFVGLIGGPKRLDSFLTIPGFADYRYGNASREEQIQMEVDEKYYGDLGKLMGDLKAGDRFEDFWDELAARGLLDRYLQENPHKKNDYQYVVAIGGIVDTYGKFFWSGITKPENKWILDEYLRRNPDKRAMHRYMVGLDRIWTTIGKDFTRFYSELAKDPWLEAEYFRRNPEKAGKGANSAYGQAIGAIVKRATSGKHFYELLAENPWVEREYFRRHPEKKAQQQANQEYMRWMGQWVEHLKGDNFVEAQKVWDSMPAWVRERYLSRNPDSGMADGSGSGSARADGTFRNPEARARFIAGQEYYAAMGEWIALLDAKDYKGADEYFRNLPVWMREKYFAKHPDQRARMELDSTMLRAGAEYFLASGDDKLRILKANPELADWLAKHGGNEAAHRGLIIQIYRAIPSKEAWLKRTFRERYPEVFGEEALGERKMASIIRELAENPEILPFYLEAVKLQYHLYSEQIKRNEAAPKPWTMERTRRLRNRGKRRGARLHSGWTLRNDLRRGRSYAQRMAGARA